MAQTCSVAGCQSMVPRGKVAAVAFKFYRFPRDESLLEKWKEAVKVVDPGPRDRVCNVHFAERDYMLTNLGWKVLVAGAVPSLHLPLSNTCHIQEEANRSPVKKKNEDYQSAAPSNSSGGSHSSSKLVSPIPEPSADKQSYLRKIRMIRPRVTRGSCRLETENALSIDSFRPKSRNPTSMRVPYKTSSYLKWKEGDEIIENKSTGENFFDCSYCGALFESRLLLLLHFSLHFDQYVCFKCGKRFPVHRKLVEHQINCAYQKTYSKSSDTLIKFCPFICKLCGLSYSSRSELRSHSNSNHVDPPFKCFKCKNNFQTARLLVKHVSSQHLKNECFCDICERSFKTLLEWNLHGQRHGFPNECPECCEQFLIPSELASHLKTHNSVIFFVCDFCPLIFSSIEAIESHLEIHQSRVKVAKCQFCSEDSSSVPQANFHVHQFLDSSTAELSAPSVPSSQTGKGTSSLMTSEEESSPPLWQTMPIKVELQEIDGDTSFNIMDHLQPVTDFMKPERDALGFSQPVVNSREALGDISMDTRLHSQHLGAISKVKVEELDVDDDWDSLYQETLPCRSPSTDHEDGLANSAESTNQMRNKLPNELLHCVDCDKTFLCENDMITHQTMHKNKGDFSCIDCGMHCHSSLALAEHYKDHIKNEKEEGWSSDDDQ